MGNWKLRTVASLVVAATLSSFGCVAEQSSSSRHSSPSVSAAPIEAPLSKITSPAFASDFDGKTVKFVCQWQGFSQLDALGDPSYVTIQVSADGVSGYYTFIGIPKASYDAAAKLKNDQKLSMTGRAEAMSTNVGAITKIFVERFEATQ